MLMPLGDDNSDRHTTPVVTYLLIAINLAVWLLELSLGERFINGYSTVPLEITTGNDLVGTHNVQAGGQNVAIQLYPGPTPIHLTLLSSMFMHASWMHIIGNMLYLWIFGDNIENRIGAARFLGFYLLCGLVASLAHIAFAMDSTIPSLGASGAIAGVLGAYLVLFPRRQVRVMVARQIVNMPAFIVLGLWILLQFFGQFTIADEGGVAYMAHIGGFVAGIALIYLFGGRRVRPPRDAMPGGAP